MNEKLIKKDLRRKFGQSGWTVLVYYLIMNAAVSVCVFVDLMIYMIQTVLNPALVGANMEEMLTLRLMSNGWGYILSCLTGGLILLLWKKTDFCFRQIWKKGKPMTVKAFAVLFCAFFSAQALFTLLTPLVEWLLNLIGLSALESVENATGAADSVSMFLYMALFAPVFEELLFRGLILRNLMPYGKKIAILGSAFLFGIFHGNLVQTPYAFAAGLVLGYAAAEYSLVWAIVLHFLNNFVLGDLVTRLSELIPGGWVDFAVYIFIFGCAAISLILAAVKSRKIADYLSVRRIHPWCLQSFFRSPGVVVLTVLMVLNMVTLLFM